MKIESYADDKQILASGMCIFAKDEQTILDIDSEKGLRFKIKFAINEEDKDTGFYFKTLQLENGDKELQITKNGDISELGTGMAERVKIGSIDGKPLSIFAVFYKMFQGRFYKIEYAFYKG